MLRHWLSIFSLLLFFPVAAYAQKGHAKDVLTEYPMPELFLQPVKYVAHTGTTVLYLRTEQQYCYDNDVELSPCLIVPYSTEIPDTWVDSDELFSVVVPRKSLGDVISFLPRFGPSFSLRNYDGYEHDALFQARLVVTLDSPAFPDGPVNTTFGDRRVTMSLSPEKMFGDTIHYTRHGIINRQWLRDNVGLTESQVEAFFNNDITVRVRVRFRAALMEYGSVYVGVLIQGY